jgi:hypothetical protein
MINTARYFQIQHMRNFYSIFLFICGFLIQFRLLAQSSNSGTLTNDGGTIDNHPTWINTVDGNYIGSNNGVFNHFGSSTLTFTNHGSYLATTGHTDVFQGPDAAAGPQEIAGTKRPRFFNVEFVNGAGSPMYISNTEGIGIAGNLHFENGITSTLRNLHDVAALVFEPGSGYSNGDTDEQHVNGYVSKIGNTAFTFPVGDGTEVRSVAISAPLPEAAHISTAWIAGDPATTADPSDPGPFHATNAAAYPIVSISDIGQWDWIVPVVPSNDITVTVSLPDVSKFATAANLRLVGWDGTKWVNLSSAGNASGVTKNSTLSGIVPSGTSVSALAIGSTEAALPVQLVSFSARAIEKSKILLTWQTAREYNNDYFRIEHSYDARSFEAVGTVKGKGNVQAQNTDYSFIHNLSVTGGVHYYRLKQVDLDETFAYSKMRSVDLGEPSTMVYPNPATDKINIEIADWKMAASIDLYDLRGKKVYQTRDKMPLLQIDSRFFPSGIYEIRVKYANGIQSTKKIAIAN